MYLDSYRVQIKNGMALSDAAQSCSMPMVTRLKATGARLIWATTTPVPNGGNLLPTRRFGSVDEYNRIAKKVMDENSVAINDLNGSIAPRMKELQQANDVHFNSAGSELLAKHVAASIETALNPKSK